MLLDEQKIEREKERVEEIDGIEWTGKNPRDVKGRMYLSDNVYVEFDFNSFPSFKIFPRSIRRELPPVIDLLPTLAIWEENDVAWADLLVDLREALAELLIIKQNQLSHDQLHSDQDNVLLDRKVIGGLLEIAKKVYPKETIFLLKRDASGVISQAVLPQGSGGGETMAYIVPSRLPADPNIVGSFHSHPSGVGLPSSEDLNMFKRYRVNIIAYYPFGVRDFKVYDNRGKERSITYVD